MYLIAGKAQVREEVIEQGQIKRVADVCKEAVVLLDEDVATVELDLDNKTVK